MRQTHCHTLIFTGLLSLKTAGLYYSSTRAHFGGTPFFSQATVTVQTINTSEMALLWLLQFWPRRNESMKVKMTQVGLFMVMAELQWT